MLLPGTYANGFAPRDGRPLYPELWKGCVGAWNPGLGVSGLTLRDNSGFKNNGTLTNGPTWAVNQGRYAMSFDGTNDYVDYGTGVNIYGLSQFSCSYWVYLASNIQTYVLSRHDENVSPITGDYFGTFSSRDAPPQAIANFKGATGYDSINFRSTNSLALNRLNHVAISVNLVTPANTTISINGVPDIVIISTGGGTPPTTFKAATATTWKSARITASAGHHLYTQFIADDIMLFRNFMSYRGHRLLATRRGIAYEMAPRRRSSSAVPVTSYSTFRPSVLRGSR